MKKSVQSRKWEKIVGEENNDSIICRNIRCYNVSNASNFMCYLLICVSEKYQTDRRKDIERKMEKIREKKTNKKERKKPSKEEIGGGGYRQRKMKRRM